MGSVHNLYTDDNRLNNRANALALFAIAICAVSYSINFAMKGWFSSIWIVITGCGLSAIVILLFKKARGLFNPAFAVPFLIFALFTTGSVLSHSFSGYFTVFFCLCGLAMMYFSPWRYLLFIILANTVSLILILTGINESKNSTELFANWIFALVGSLFIFIATRFVSQRIRKTIWSEDSFETLLSSTPDYIVLVDELNYVSYISKPLAEFAHIEVLKYALGRPLLDLFRDMEVKLKVAEILDSQGLYEGTWELTQDGKTRFFKITSDRLLGESAGLFISLSDITSLVKARAEAEAADRAKSAFLANTSHEIRTPMNAILGMTELILRKDIAPDVFEDITNIKQAGTNLINIINDVLDFSKIESGKLEIIPAEYYFASMVNDVINIMRLRFIEKHLNFITHIDGSLPSVLVGDENRVRQVLLNLLSNAAKYTIEGDVVLRIFSVEFPGEEGSLPGIVLVFEVSDTGIGIQKENLNKLFGEFERIDTRANRGIEGTGLGLAISRNLCRLMGGDITVISEYGTGSIFKAIIPQEIKDSSPFVSVKEPENKTVVIFENREKYARALAYSAKKLGVKHFLTGAKEEFMDLLKANPSSYVLFSFLLFAEAKETLNLLSEGNTAGRKIKPAILTDYGEEEFREKLLPEDLNNYHLLSMPVHPITLSRYLNDEEITALPAGNYSSVSFTSPAARLLVVDDIPTNLKVAEGLLKPYKSIVDTCLNGAEAIEMVKKQAYDIVFMDHMMPVMNGIDATAAIRTWESEYGKKRIPIVALTANAVSGMKEMFLENGFNDFLPKPIETQKLDDVLRKWIPGQKRLLIPVQEKSQNPEDEEFKGINIPGLDLRHGMAMTGGKFEWYLQVLNLYCKDAGERLPVLNGFTSGEYRPEDFDFPAFTSQIHALKSASASVGAIEISKDAAQLEAAGKAEDFIYLQQTLPGFTKSLKKLVKEISQAVSKITLPGEAKINSSSLLPALQKLKEALAGQNQEAIDTILEELNQKAADPGLKQALEQISDQVLLAEFDEAVKILDELKAF